MHTHRHTHTPKHTHSGYLHSTQVMEGHPAASWPSHVISLLVIDPGHQSPLVQYKCTHNLSSYLNITQKVRKLKIGQLFLWVCCILATTTKPLESLFISWYMMLHLWVEQHSCLWIGPGCHSCVGFFHMLLRTLFLNK